MYILFVLSLGNRVVQGCSQSTNERLCRATLRERTKFETTKFETTSLFPASSWWFSSNALWCVCRIRVQGLLYFFSFFFLFPVFFLFFPHHLFFFFPSFSLACLSSFSSTLAIQMGVVMGVANKLLYFFFWGQP